MNDTEKIAVANDIISNLEKELILMDSKIRKLKDETENKQVRIWQLNSKIEVYQDVIETLIKELRGDK